MLQFDSGSGTFTRVALEDALELARLGMLGACMEAVLAIACRLQQVIEYIDHILGVDHIHGAVGGERSAVGGALPRRTGGGAYIGPGQAVAAVACAPVVCQARFDGVKVALVAAHGRPAQFVGGTVLVVGAAPHVVRLAVVGFAPVGVFFGGADGRCSRLASQAAGHSPCYATNGSADRAAESTSSSAGSGATQGSTHARSDGVSTRLIGQRVTVGIVEIRHRNISGWLTVTSLLKPPPECQVGPGRACM